MESIGATCSVRDIILVYRMLTTSGPNEISLCSPTLLREQKNIGHIENCYSCVHRSLSRPAVECTTLASRKERSISPGKFTIHCSSPALVLSVTSTPLGKVRSRILRTCSQYRNRQAQS